MVCGTGMSVPSGECRPGFTENDDPSGASIHAESTTGTNIIVKYKKNSVVGVNSWTLSSCGFHHSVGRNHVNALPGTNIHATFTQNALALIDMDELFWFDRSAQVISVYFDQLVLIGEGHHRWIGVGSGHDYTFFTKGRP